MKRFCLLVISLLLTTVATYANDGFDIFDNLESGEEFDFYGFKGKSFENGGLKYKVVQPAEANENRSWVIRARFWGHQPQLDRRLLELGFHIAYCGVEDLFGSPKAVARWDSFYKIMRKAGLNKRVVLEGMSRGGLIVYNWAVKNPKKVSAIYADAPVLDIKSWPLGSDGYVKAQEAALKAYDMTLEEIMEYRGNPLDNAAKIAKARLPIIHVVGDADDVVPYSDNTARFAEILRENGAEIEVIVKSGVGHHPHSLEDPQRLVDFILMGESKK
ncbi:MAG: prolyl oligopeptidase family serine peptidase [Rikenellaceae bacterium]